MLFDILQNFEWLNEPSEIYLDSGLKIVSAPNTDFWQSYREDFHKDDGHLFFIPAQGDFELNIKWSFLNLTDFSQCGIMLRIDEFNWFKASIMSKDGKNFFIGSSVTNFGTSDLATHAMIEKVENIWYRIICKAGGFSAFYSIDGDDFNQIRIFDLLQDTTYYQVGAYACCPGAGRFAALLETVEIKN